MEGAESWAGFQHSSFSTQPWQLESTERGERSGFHSTTLSFNCFIFLWPIRDEGEIIVSDTRRVR